MKGKSRYAVGVIEPLRLCIVLFFAGLGNEVGSMLHASITDPGVEPQALGVLLGAAIGYVLGGVLARLTVKSMQTAERAISERSPERVFGGVIGTLFGVFVAAGVSWPLLLVGHSTVTVPLFLFAILATGTLGYRVGGTRRHALIRLLAAPSGMATPVVNAVDMDRVIDTSVAIDGRIIDVIRAGFLHGSFIVLHPVLEELQGLADSGEDLRRARGRRGLETLDALRRERGIELEVVPDPAREIHEVDAKLVRACLDRPGALLTLDSNLAKAASLAGVRVMNLHTLALAMRPPVSAGDSVPVLMTKPGRESGQAVGYLDDGTMVVVERARGAVGTEIEVVVTSVLTTANGRMIFAKRTVVDPPTELPSQSSSSAAAFAARIHQATVNEDR